MSVTIFIKYKNKLYYDRLLPDFCREIKDNFGKNICTCFHSKDEQLHMCEGGLWCRSYRIGKEEELGYIIIGHRRIYGKDNDSWSTLKDLIKDRNLSEFSRIRLCTTFEAVPIVKEEDFESILFKKLSLLEEIILRERARADNETKISQELRQLTESMKKNSDDLRTRTIKATHEFQIPIQSMVGEAEYLFNCIKKNRPVPKCGKRDSVTISFNLLDKLIKLSFIANNLREIGDQSIRYDFDKIDYIAILKETIEWFRSEADEKGVIIKEIELINGPDHKIEASEQYIKQLFFNIIHNSVKYSFDSTEYVERYITISIIGYVNYVSIKVSNYGIGITSHDLGKIFTQGYRGELAGDRCRIGSGLGLWIAKRIVSDHNGKIRIESKKVGSGVKVDPYLTTVIIDLPVWQPIKI